MKTKFFVKVDKRNRSHMIDFLLNHFRYYTLNSWNNQTAWANNMKIYKVIPNKLQETVYNFINDPGVDEHIHELLINAKTDKYYFEFNGRSGDYLVMYNYVGAGKFSITSVDDYTKEDYKDMKISQLIEITKRVQTFDKLCDNVVDEIIYMANNI